MRLAGKSQWKVTLASRILLIIGLIDILSATFKPLNTRLKVIAVPLADIWPTLATAGVIIDGVILMALSFALARRSHAAYLLTQISLLTNIPLHLITGHRLFLLSLIPIVFLFLMRAEFYAKPHRKVVTRALIIFAEIFAINLGIGVFLVLAPDQLFGGDVSFIQVMRTVFNGLVGNTGPLRFVSNREQDVFGIAMLGLGILNLIAPILALLQPSPPKSLLSNEDEEKLRGLINNFGERDSIAYFALREDKSVIWSSTGKAAVTYRVVSGCALASGDPIGNPDAWPQAMQAFLEFARVNGWVPAVFGCSEEAGEIWVRESKMSSLEIGDEAIVRVSDYDLESPRYRSIRQTVRKIQKQDYTTHIYRSNSLTPDMRSQLTLNSKKWRGDATERGFMMGLGRIAESNEPDLLIVTAVADGVVRGILQYVPWGEKGLSLDLMRRDPHAHAGMNELMIDATINFARANGIEKISLNFAAFRAVFERGGQLGAGPIIRSWRSILLFFSRWIQMESLYRFNAKFRPEWLPRFAIFGKASDLPRIGLAILRAEAFIGSRTLETKKTTSLG
ncbi:MAG: phosphatidylglycerol lysyltransferase domain-containing protein [Actinobacteria bacterium]|nr:phosphatidylglycerol lysyltransferase domain-containing protein [Actinomycetota bacterium]